MSLTSEEVNYLIYRYFHEAGLLSFVIMAIGFLHSAFTFGHESLIYKSQLRAEGDEYAGMLVTLLHKGLLYSKMEYHLLETGASKPCNRPFSLFGAHSCGIDSNESIMDEPKAEELIIKSTKKSKSDRKKRNDDENFKKDSVVSFSPPPLNVMDNSKETVFSPEFKSEENLMNADKITENESIEEKIQEIKMEDHGDMMNLRAHHSPERQTFNEIEKLELDVETLYHHSKGVYSVSFNQMNPALLASASSDGTAIIWDIGNVDNYGLDKLNTKNGGKNEHRIIAKLEHLSTDNSSVDATTVEWNVSHFNMNLKHIGTLLATGAYDGTVNIWTCEGSSVCKLSYHSRPVFTVRWNLKDSLLLTASFDKSVALWNISSESNNSTNPWQVYTCFPGPVLDIDWKNSTIFGATSNQFIYICKVGEANPLMIFNGHQLEVNSLRWDQTGTLLASGSDDKTAKIWSMTQEEPLHTLVGHTRDVYSVAWAPTKTPLLATASFDGSVRVWSVVDGSSLLVLTNHLFPVYTVAFSPNGHFLASGSYDKNIHIHRISIDEKTSTITCINSIPDAVFQDTGGIYDISWHPSGNILAAGSDAGNVQVLRLLYSIK